MPSNQESAGILLYRRGPDGVEVLIGHPGGPFWAHRDAGAWTIPKGLIEEGENPVATARREFMEEIGIDPGVDLVPLGSITQKSGKTVHAWAASGFLDPAELDSNLVEIEYPRGSGKLIQFPEIDRVMWASAQVAKTKLNPAQVELVVRLQAKLAEQIQDGS
jgi:predicted NUDIX family NTP pyrophosphohydrolase